MRGWWLWFKEQAELADAAVIAAQENRRLHTEVAAAKAALRNVTIKLEVCRRDADILLQLVPDPSVAMGLLRDAHLIDRLDEVQR